MSTKKTQKILVPKGTIQSNEDVLIEIPVELKDQPMVIARRPQSGKSRVKPSDLKMVEYDEEDPPVQPAVKYKPRRVAPQQESEEFLPPFSSSTMHSSTRPVPGLDNLDETEALEKQLIQKKLEEFQQARRMFILETTGVAAHSSHMFHNTTFSVPDDPGTFNESTYPKKNLNTSRRNSCCNPITSDTHSFTKGRSSHDEDDRYSDKDQSSCGLVV
ncbi:uncharacterized protein LOC115891785 [Sitophilus oryzae]|uniref:Uncharacterized protein LOC115891785 n=1 Tax=Sitophilus oryzae TaxID=7048 RepID=A0A6J2YZF7_SITOR|nr:uncharacterized protein LOC115891785 [Sitophilus oryzae]